MKHSTSFLALVAAVSLAACDKTPTTPGAGSADGVVVGSVESTSTASSSSSPLRTMSLSSSGAEVQTASVARVRADGSLDVVTSAQVAADGSFRIEQVPTGEDRLVVVARNSAGAQVASAILHQAAQSQQETAVTPLDSETTVEARVYAELRKSGMSKDAINTVELAQSIEFEQKATASAVITSAQDLKAIADGYKAKQDTYTEVLVRRGTALDAKARFEAEVSAAAAYANARQAGAAEQAAEAELQAKIEAALVARGVDVQKQVEASSASETGFLAASMSASTQARLELGKNAVRRAAQQRKARTAEALAKAGATLNQIEAAKASFANAIAQIDQATSVEAAAYASARAGVSVKELWGSAVTENGWISATAEMAWKQAMASLPGEGEIAAQVGTSSDASVIAAAYVSYNNALRTAVEAAVTQARAFGSSLNAEAAVELQLALSGHISAR